MTEPVDYLPRGSWAYEIERSRLAWLALGYALWDALPGWLRRAIERTLT